MKAAAQLFTRAVAWLSRIGGAIAAGMIVACVLVVCQMVFVRFVLNQASSWQTEFTTYCMIAAILVGSPYVLLHRGHVNVDLIPRLLGPRARLALALFQSLVVLLFCGVIAVYGGMYWYELWVEQWVSDTVWGVRLWIPYLALPVGMGLLTLQQLARIVELAAGLDRPFGLEAEDTL